MNNEGIASLTHAEREALALLGEGYDIKACASRIGISDHAVTERPRSARRKLGATSSRAAARMLREARDAPYSFSGDSFSGLAGDAALTPVPPLPAGQAEWRQGNRNGSDLREVQLAFDGPSASPTVLPYLPLRGVDARENSLSKAQRVQTMIDLSIKIAALAALMCLIALALNMAIPV